VIAGWIDAIRGLASAHVIEITAVSSSAASFHAREISDRDNNVYGGARLSCLRAIAEQVKPHYWYRRKGRNG
jgi:hypothetical protein